MSASIPSVPSASDIEATLRDELACGLAVEQTIAPILKHLLGTASNSVFTDDVIASSRGMVADVSRQLIQALANEQGQSIALQQDSEAVQAMTIALIENPLFLAHIHALALEWQLTQRLQTRQALDPVLPPLLQSMMASENPATASLAMHVLAAQVRFCQAQRRMKLPLSELPVDLLHSALSILSQQSETAATRLRQGYDEGKSRSALLSRLIVSLGGNASVSLSVTNSGVAMFVSALSMATAQSRDAVALSTNETQIARLALALRASGMRHQDVEAQFFTVHPEIALPDGFDQLSPDRAAAVLALAAQSGRI